MYEQLIEYIKKTFFIYIFFIGGFGAFYYFIVTVGNTCVNTQESMFFKKTHKKTRSSDVIIKNIQVPNIVINNYLHSTITCDAGCFTCEDNRLVCENITCDITKNNKKIICLQAKQACFDQKSKKLVLDGNIRTVFTEGLDSQRFP